MGVFCVLLGYVYFFTSFLPFFHHPMRAKVASLSSEYEKMSAELEKARKTVGNLAKLEAEYDRLHDKWVAAQGLLPKDKEVADLLRKVTRIGSQSGIDFLLFEPQPPVQREFITENPVKVKVRGEYHQLGIFLSKVANLDRIVNVSQLGIKPADTKNGTGQDRMVRNYTIEAEMTLTAYTLVEGGETSNEKTNEKTQQKVQTSDNS
ncbi:MAG: type 4a pilus biogenesis protein PilO [Candidatus Krumholzibacteria bacterium]|nr:type 4a pilus biogenesis protein PilO [Candidatus Krumholzibacteria bacterium]